MQWSRQGSDRVFITDPVRKGGESSGFQYEQVESTLTIHNIEKSDEGVYRCTVTNHEQKSNFKEITIDVIAKTYVSLHADQKEVVLSLGSDEVILRVGIQAYPRPALQWIKDGRPINLDDERKYDSREKLDRILLKIFNPIVSDAGRYTLKAHTEDMNAEESIDVLVTGSIHRCILFHSSLYHSNRTST